MIAVITPTGHTGSKVLEKLLETAFRPPHQRHQNQKRPFVGDQ